MQKPGEHISLWIKTAPSTDYPSLRKDTTVDVVIIGGGIAGITTAYFLKEKGLKVALCEADRIVKNVTGYTTAKVPSLHDVIYNPISKSYGKDQAQLYADANQDAIEMLAAIIKKNNIDCDFIRKDSYTYTQENQYIDDLKKEATTAKDIGLPAEFTTEVPLPFKVKAAVCFKNQAQFHPRKYLLALSKTIADNKNFLFEQTRALKIREGEPCIVETATSSIKAKYIVIATHFPIFDENHFYARMYQQRSYVLAAKIKSKLPSGMFISIEHPFHTFRTQRDGMDELLIFGGQDHKSGQGGDTQKRYNLLEKKLKEWYSLSSIKYSWSTQDNMTPDKIPYVGRSTKKSKYIFVATGFNGWGMTNSVVAAQLLTDLITGKKNPLEKLYDPSRLTLQQTKELIAQNINTGIELVKGKV